MPRKLNWCINMPKQTRVIPNYNMTLLLVYDASRKIFKARRGNECRFVHKGDTFPTRTTRLLVRSSGLCEAYNQTCPNWDKKFTTTCWCHFMIPCQVSWISYDFWIYRNLKNKFLNVCGLATKRRCLKLTHVSCMGPKHSLKDTHIIFQPTLEHWIMCM